jgi:hypothetical protein
MKQGYTILGIDGADSDDNIKAAYALSISLKLADPDRETCVVVTSFDDVTREYSHGFDYIVELPFGRTDANHHDIMIDWWQIYYCTPFTETMSIHNCSLAIDNIEMLWAQTNDVDIAFANSRDFRGTLRSDVERNVAQQRNDVPAFSANLVYFRKSYIASEFFKLADPVFRNWRNVYRDMLTEYRPTDFALDLMCNLTADQLGASYPVLELFDYTNLKINFLFDPENDDQAPWQSQYICWITDDLQVKINNYRQTGVFHYGDPELLTKGIMQKINDSFNKKTN